MYTATEYILELHVENNKDRKTEIFGKLQDAQIVGVKDNNCLYSKKISTDTPLAKMKTDKLYEFLERVYKDKDIEECCKVLIQPEVAITNTDTIPEANS
jgi:hypothetical protein